MKAGHTSITWTFALFYLTAAMLQVRSKSSLFIQHTLALVNYMYNLDIQSNNFIRKDVPICLKVN